MAFQLSWNGVALNLDSDEIQEFIEQNIPICNSQIVTTERIWPTANVPGLSYPLGDPEPIDNTVGCWNYPTGAGRWSQFNTLISDRIYSAIVPASYTTNGAVANNLVLQQGATTVSSPMFLLPPRPIAKFGTKPGIYLATFVDARYFWQFNTPGNVVITDSTTWTTLLNTLLPGIKISTPIESVYGQPHPYSDLFSRYENLAVLLDSCMWSTGRTLVRNLDGSFTAQKSSEAMLTAALQKPKYQLAGGDFSLQDIAVAGNMLPQSVTITFPKRKLSDGTYIGTTYKIPYGRNSGDVYVIVISISSTNFASYYGVSGATKIIHSTADAWYNLPSDTYPQNLSQLNALATQLANDYYQFTVSDGLDISFPSIFAWQPEGLHDITWYWCKDSCYTRVQHKPYNWQTLEYQHHFVGTSGSTSGIVTTGCCNPKVIVASLNGPYQYYANVGEILIDESSMSLSSPSSGVVQLGALPSSGQSVTSGTTITINVTSSYTFQGGGNIYVNNPIYFDSPVYNSSGYAYSPLTVENVYAPQNIVPQTVILYGNNDQTSAAFGRICYTSGGLGQAVTNWQGLRAYYAGTGYTHAAPDIEFQAGTPNVTIAVSDDIPDQRAVVAISVTSSSINTSSLTLYNTTLADSSTFPAGSTTIYQSGSTLNSSGTVNYSPGSTLVNSGTVSYQSGNTTIYQSGSTINSSANVNYGGGTVSYQSGSSTIYQSGSSVTFAPGSTFVTSGTILTSAGIVASKSLATYSGTSTSAYVTVFSISNAAGLSGVVGIKNTGSTAALAWQGNFTDFFGTTSASTNSLASQVTQIINLYSIQQGFVDCAPPYQTLTLMVKDNAGGQHANYAINLSLLGT